ncbi:MAG: signal transduction protein [Alphaproteobacteria bacterium]|nr:signal transduction protein [Alphaproteobacteria bacterium]
MAIPRILVAVAAFAIPLAAQAQPGTGRDPAQAIDRIFEADSNGDGKVTRPELLVWRTQQWSRLDRNRDGYFTRDDLPAFAASRWNGPRLVQLRDQFDVNRDGRLSRAEFTDGPTPAFALADANRDGTVTRAEVQTALDTTRQLAQSGGAAGR